MRLTSKYRDTLYTVAAAILAVAMLAANAEAQSTRSGSGDARMQQALQQLTNEKARLQAENAKLKQDAEEAAKLRKQNEKLTSDLEYAEKKLTRTEGSNENLEASLVATRARLEELVARFRELATDFRETEVALAETSATLRTRSQALLTCADNNDEIAIIANEALDRYENKGLFTRTREAEPFTGITRARIRNLVEEYRFQVDDLRLEKDITAGITEVQPASGGPGE